jgi:hypothetical protein
MRLSDLSDIEIKGIIEGYWNLLIPNEDVEIIAATRREICDVCEHKAETKCSICGCPIRAKSRSMTSKCPDTPPRWDAHIKYLNKK